LRSAGGRDECPEDGPNRAKTLKTPALLATHADEGGAVMGPNADMRAIRECLEILRDSLKSDSVVRNMHVGNVSSRMDRNNKVIDLIKEVLGDKIQGEVEFLQPCLAYGIVAAWGSIFITYWVDDTVELAAQIRNATNKIKLMAQKAAGDWTPSAKA
jgi:hypothetical protein